MGDTRCYTPTVCLQCICLQVVEPKKAIVDEDVKKAEASAGAANAIKTECEDALAEAIPILEVRTAPPYLEHACSRLNRHNVRRLTGFLLPTHSCVHVCVIVLLQAAISALDTIKPADIKLVQSFKNPPGAIKIVMEAVCVLLDIKPQRCAAAVWIPSTPWPPPHNGLNKVLAHAHHAPSC